MEELTQENYYQDTSWLTNSRFKRYQQCQAKAFALDSGQWIEERDETPLLLGNYVHSYFESPEAHQHFMDENGDKLLAKTGKNKGNLKSDFVIGDKMIASLKDDDGFNHLYHGYPSDEVQKELIDIKFQSNVSAVADSGVSAEYWHTSALIIYRIPS